MEESYLIRKEQCPECAKLGKDQSKDNLGIYSDGHKYCFSCGFTIPVSSINRFRNRNVSTREKFGHERPLDKQESGLYLPEDCEVNYPQRALEWVGQYELTRTDLLNHNTLWSESLQRLIFPVYGDSGLLAYQGRYFGSPSTTGKPYPKWYGKGDLKGSNYIIGSKNKSKIILVEDIISAIRVSKFCDCMPLFGSFISIDRLKKIKQLEYKKIGIFLDPDKQKESMVFSKKAQLLGFNVKTILASKDPKELKDSEIDKYIDF